MGISRLSEGREGREGKGNVEKLYSVILSKERKISCNSMRRKPSGGLVYLFVCFALAGAASVGLVHCG